MSLMPKLNNVFIYTCGGKYNNIIDRYNSYVDTVPGLGPEGDCWEWKGVLNNDGYGIFNYGKNTSGAHRVSYELFYGILIPKGICVCHHCDNPSCVRPSHLFLGTIADNVKDKVKKGRQSSLKYENHGMAKLTWIQVREIRRLYNEDNYTLDKLSKIFLVNCQNISSIIRNKTWYDKNYIRIKFKSGNSKFTIEQIDEIRRLYSTKKYTQKQLVKLYLTNTSNISDIINNKRWTNKNYI